jgi:hypothetical protein
METTFASCFNPGSIAIFVCITPATCEQLELQDITKGLE